MMKRKLFQSATLLAAVMLSAGICLTGCNRQQGAAKAESEGQAAGSEEKVEAKPEEKMEPQPEESGEAKQGEKGETKQNGYKIDATFGTAEGEAVEAPKPDDAEAVNGTSVNSKGEDTILGEDEYKGDDEDTATNTDQASNTNPQTIANNSSEKLSMTDAEIQALLKKYPNLATIDEVKNVLKTGTTPDEVEELLQEMQADRAKNPPQQQVTQPTTQYEEVIYDDPNWQEKFDNGDYSNRSTTGHTY